MIIKVKLQQVPEVQTTEPYLPSLHGGTEKRWKFIIKFYQQYSVIEVQLWTCLV